MKIKERSKKKKRLGKVGLITVIGLSAIVAAIVYSYYQQKESDDRQFNWVTSGPFAINSNQYKLGNHIFIVVTGLKPTDVGEADFVDPKGDVYTSIQFNGTLKSSFNQFFEPNTERKLGICNATALVGHWNVVFKGVPWKPIPFDIINEYLPGMSNKTEGLDTVPKGLDPC